MASSAQAAWKPGTGPTVECAAEDAWNNAKNGIGVRGKKVARAKAAKTTYKIHISIVASNPIHSYIVTIDPPGP